MRLLILLFFGALLAVSCQPNEILEPRGDIEIEEPDPEETSEDRGETTLHTETGDVIELDAHARFEDYGGFGPLIVTNVEDVCDTINFFPTEDYSFFFFMFADSGQVFDDIGGFVFLESEEGEWITAHACEGALYFDDETGEYIEAEFNLEVEEFTEEKIKIYLDADFIIDYDPVNGLPTRLTRLVFEIIAPIAHC